MTYRVAVAFPSTNPERHARARAAWAAQGYEIYTVVSWESPFYNGYFACANELCHYAVREGCDLVVAAADDLFPDPNHSAHAIAHRYFEKFPNGYGVMQPCGDPSVPKTICGSPWMDRRWVRESYSGYGPFYQGYRHFYGDEELLHVAQRQNALWMALPFFQRHEHWTVPGGPPKTDYQIRNNRHWDHDKALFNGRLAQNFPGSLPCS